MNRKEDILSNVCSDQRPHWLAYYSFFLLWRSVGYKHSLKYVHPNNVMYKGLKQDERVNDDRIFISVWTIPLRQPFTFHCATLSRNKSVYSPDVPSLTCILNLFSSSTFKIIKKGLIKLDKTIFRSQKVQVQTCSLVKVVVNTGCRRNWQFWSFFPTGQTNCILGAAAAITASGHFLSVSSFSFWSFISVHSTSRATKRECARFFFLPRSLRFRVIGAGFRRCRVWRRDVRGTIPLEAGHDELPIRSIITFIFQHCFRVG